MALQAARDGFGVALSDEINSSRDLREGTLVQPFPLKVPAEMDYFCIFNEERSAAPEVKLFVDWIVKQAGSV